MIEKETYAPHFFRVAGESPVEAGNTFDGNGAATRGRSALNDHDALARLLKLGMAEVTGAGETISLDSSEELSRLVPILCVYFSREEMVELVGEKAAGKILKLYQVEMLQNLLLEGELQRVLRAFNAAGIKLMLIKGPALPYTIYPKAHLRTYHDIDGLVHEFDLARARNLLAEMGYESYEEYRSNAIDKTRTGYNFILKWADSWHEVLIELHIAPHASEIGSDFDVSSLWARAQPIEVLGELTSTMHPVDHLLFLCWHYRFHGFSRLLWLYDIVTMVRTFDEWTEWVDLVATARRQNLATTLYYCLRWCRDLFGVTIPQAILAELRPPLVCRLLVERIAMPDTARALSAASGRSRRIIARHAMVDSTLRLLNAGVVVFFPPPAMLARRYMNKSRLPLRLFFLYYLVHPWLTLAKWGSRLFKSRRNRGRQP